MKLTGKVTLVTGGGKGIGEAICVAYGAEGAAVVVADLDLDGARRVVERIRSAGGTATSVEVDVARSASVDAMANAVIREHGRIDVSSTTRACGRSRAFSSIPRRTGIGCSRSISPDRSFVLKRSCLRCSRPERARSSTWHPSRASWDGRTAPATSRPRPACSASPERSRWTWPAGTSTSTPSRPVSSPRRSTPASRKIRRRAPAWGKETLVGRWGQPEDVAGAAVFLASDDSGLRQRGGDQDRRRLARGQDPQRGASRLIERSAGFEHIAAGGR